MAQLEEACARAFADGSAAPVRVEILSERVASALLGAGREVLSPPAFSAFEAALALGHRPLPGEN